VIILLPLISAALYGIAPLLYGKYVKRIGTLWASLLSSAPPLIFSLLVGGVPRVGQIELLKIVVASILGGFIGTLGYMKSIELLGSELAVVLTSTYILYVPLVALLLGVEEVSAGVIAGGLLVFTGIYTLYRSPVGLNLRGLCTTQITAVSWSLSTNLLAIALRTTQTLDALLIRSTTNLSLLLLLILLLRPPTPRTNDMLKFTSLSMLDSLIGLYLFLKSIELAGPSLATVVVSTYPIYPTIAKVLRSAELREVVGLILVVSGVLVAGSSR